MPSILQADNSIKLYMTESIQWLAFDLARHFAPAAMTAKKYSAIYGDHVAMSNNTGYGDVPRSNYPAGENLASELPAFDKQRTFAGDFLTGVESYSAFMAVLNIAKLLSVGQFRNSFMAMKPENLLANNVLMCRPGVDAIDANGFAYKTNVQRQPLAGGGYYKPDTPESLAILQEILDRHWYCVATANGGDRAFNFPHLLPAPVVYPFILSRDSYWPLAWFQRWDRDYLPNPLEVYL